MATNVLAVNNNNTWGRSSAPTTNFFGDPNKLGWRSDPLTDHLWLDFTLPSGSGVISQISLFMWMVSNEDTQTQSVGCYQLTESFVEGSATWNTRDGSTSWTTPGGTFNSTVIQATNAVATSNFQQWDLVGGSSTNPVAGLTWSSNIKLLLKRVTESGTTATYDYASRSNPTSGLRPFIQITYTPALPTGNSSMMMGI